MGRRIKIPLLIDVMRVDKAETIGILAQDPRLDRAYRATGPLFNRLLAGRLMRVFRVGGTPFPTMRARDDSQRAANQAALHAKLRDAPPPGEAQIAPLAAYVRGEGTVEQLGPALQTLIGQLFKEGFAGNADLWAAAVRFDSAARSSNPLQWLKSRLTGTLEADKRTLADAVDQDPVALHAIGIAIHNIAASLTRMRECHADPIRRTALDGAAAAIACLRAPASVLRQATHVADVPGASLTPGSLVTFELAPATDRTLDPNVAFQSRAWSACPASGFVLKLLAMAWEQARNYPPRAGGQP